MGEKQPKKQGLNPSFVARSAPNILSWVTFGIQPGTPTVCDSEVVLQIYYVKTIYLRHEKYQVLQIYHVKTIYILAISFASTMGCFQFSVAVSNKDTQIIVLLRNILRALCFSWVISTNHC